MKEVKKMDIGMEECIDKLKGIACILSIMSEATDVNMIWNNWALYLLYREMYENIKKIEESMKKDKVEEN